MVETALFHQTAHIHRSHDTHKHPPQLQAIPPAQFNLLTFNSLINIQYIF
jgi:hypothetical protein